MRRFVESIELDNHTTSGNWTAAQIFYHLAGAVEGSMEGLPSGYPMIVRGLLRPFRNIVFSYRFPPLVPIPSAIKFKLEPPADAAFEIQKSRLLDAVIRFNNHREGERHLSFIAAK